MRVKHHLIKAVCKLHEKVVCRLVIYKHTDAPQQTLCYKYSLVLTSHTWLDLLVYQYLKIKKQKRDCYESVVFYLEKFTYSDVSGIGVSKLWPLGATAANALFDN